MTVESKMIFFHKLSWDEDMPTSQQLNDLYAVAYPGIFFLGGGFNEFSWEQRDGDLGAGAP